MDQPTGFMKTVVRIVHSDLIRLSDSLYEIGIDLEAQDGCSSVAKIDVYHYAENILQAWKILHPLRPRSIHYAEGTFRWNDEKLTLMAPVFVPYCGDMDLVNGIFTRYDENEGARNFQPETLKTVCGCIKEISIERAEGGSTSIIQLAERDDYCLVILPDVFEKYKGAILASNYLEYRGIPQACSIKFANDEGDCTSAIIVTSISIPNLSNEFGVIEND